MILRNESITITGTCSLRAKFFGLLSIIRICGISLLGIISLLIVSRLGIIRLLGIVSLLGIISLLSIVSLFGLGGSLVLLRDRSVSFLGVGLLGIRSRGIGLLGIISLVGIVGFGGLRGSLLLFRSSSCLLVVLLGGRFHNIQGQV